MLKPPEPLILRPWSIAAPRIFSPVSRSSLPEFLLFACSASDFRPNRSARSSSFAASIALLLRWVCDRGEERRSAFMRRAVALFASFRLVVVGKSSILSLRSVPSPSVFVLLSSEAGKSSFDAFLAGNGCGSRLVCRGGGERSRNRLLCALRRFCASSPSSEALSESLFVAERPGEALRLRCRRLFVRAKRSRPRAIDDSAPSTAAGASSYILAEKSPFVSPPFAASLSLRRRCSRSSYRLLW